ncbi:monovalent cation/H+ antiporter subunit D family protein [Thermodesulfovibrionales bacterium]|nr:monovalent cation/H+ antiporter subunit D family protein [Thermodesulfovibrionales bacterium]
MEAVHSIVPIYAIAVPLVASILIGLSGKKPNLREFWSITAAVLQFSLVASMLPSILEGNTIEFFLLTLFPGIDISFRVDAFGFFFAFMSSFLWIITSFYSIGYMRTLNEHSQTRYYICFAISLFATVGVAFSANMFTTFLFYEVITLCTYPLVAHKETTTAMKGALKYVVYLLGASLAFMLPAIFLTYLTAGTLNFDTQGILAGEGTDVLLIIIFVLFIAGIAKAAMMPFHSWLPAAMVAPTPVSALLHAVAVVKTGVFVIAKVILHIFGVDLLFQLGIDTVFIYVASFTLIAASIMALRQDNLKARLAYSTVSQLSYVILGIALLTQSGITGGVLHIVLHGFGKITLFFAAGAIYVATRKTEISQLNGIGGQMPFTMAAFTLGALSMIGIPPLGGFLSKWYIVFGSLEAGQLPIIIVIAASTILNSCYFLPIVYAAFFKESAKSPVISDALTDKDSSHVTYRTSLKEAPVFMVVPLALTGIGTLVLFFVPSVFLDLAKMTALTAIGGS